MAIKYKDFEKREQLRKDYIDKAAEAAKTQANAYTDEQIKNIPAPPAPDIPTALPQKYEAFKVQLVQGNISEGEDPMWSEYHKPLWNGSQVLTNSSATLANRAHFVTDTVLYWRSPRKYNLLITINGTEKEFVFEGEHNQYGTNWVIWQLKENDVVVAEAECIGAGNGQYYNNTSTVYVYCPDGSSYIGQTMTAARYGKKQYVYSLMNPAAILQYPSETENTRFLTMCQSIATKNAKLKLTLTDNVIEANYANISNELVTTDYVEGDYRIRWIGVVADRKPLDNGGSYHDLHDDMPTCIKGILEVEYTDEEATKECVYDKIQGESYTFKIGDFNHDESSAFDYYFNGAILIPFDTAQIQASFTYRPVSGTEKSVQVKSLVNNGQMLPYFDISELFGQAANTVMATLISNNAIENVDMGGRPVTTISLTSNVQNFTDANDEIMVGQILTIMPSSLPQTYKKKAVTLATSGWVASPWTSIAKNTVLINTYGYALIGKTSYNITSATSLAVSDTVHGYSKEPLIYKGTTSVGGIETYMFRTADNNLSIYIGYQTQNKGEIHARSTTSGVNTVTVYAQIDGVTTAYEQPYTDADVKVNSEVRFTLDEANGKIAGQFGLKKTIDKEAGKLTFTADTFPTSAISGTLEIGETSTEGAAFVEGIQPKVPTKTSELTNDSGFVTEAEVPAALEYKKAYESAAGDIFDEPFALAVADFNRTPIVGDSFTLLNNITETGATYITVATIATVGETEATATASPDFYYKLSADGGVGYKKKVLTTTSSGWTSKGGNVGVTISASGNSCELQRVGTKKIGSLGLEVGKAYTLTVGTDTYTATCAKDSSIPYFDGYDNRLIATALKFNVSGNTLVVIDNAEFDDVLNPSINRFVFDNAKAIGYWADGQNRAISASLAVEPIEWDYVYSDADITATSEVILFATTAAPSKYEFVAQPEKETGSLTLIAYNKLASQRIARFILEIFEVGQDGVAKLFYNVANTSGLNNDAGFVTKDEVPTLPSLSQANVFFYSGKYEGYPVCHVHTTTFTYNSGTGFNRSICTLAEWEAMGLPSPADKTYTLEVNNLQGFKDGTYQKITEAMTFSLILSSVDVGGVATQYVNLHWNLTDSTSSTFEVEADIVLMHN